MSNNAIIAQTEAERVALPALVDRAAAVLSNARSSAEVLEARDMASVAYDAAKKAARSSSVVSERSRARLAVPETAKRATKGSRLS